MHQLTISTTPVDSTSDMESAAEQLREIAEYDLTVQLQRFDRRARRGTFTILTSRGDRFRERLAASPYARLYTVQG